MKATERADYLGHFFLHNLGRYMQIKDLVEKICITKFERHHSGRRFIDIKIDFVAKKDTKITDDDITNNWDTDLSIFIGRENELADFLEYQKALRQPESDYENLVTMFTAITEVDVEKQYPSKEDVTVHFLCLAHAFNKIKLF
jgi:hypothetical protein